VKSVAEKQNLSILREIIASEEALGVLPFLKDCGVIGHGCKSERVAVLGRRQG